MLMLMGIDEAGRGAVLGPLVIAGIGILEEKIPELSKLNVKDSKQLTRAAREKLYAKIKAIADEIHIIKISPQEIDNAVFSDKTNLNWLEAEKIAQIINKSKASCVYIDCPSPNIRSYTAFLKKLLRIKDTTLVISHKADIKYKIVSAASIIAKVERDMDIDQIKSKYGDCGPGYPANQITKKFIEENFEKYPWLFRKSWATISNHITSKKQKSLNDF